MFVGTDCLNLTLRSLVIKFDVPDPTARAFIHCGFCGDSPFLPCIYNAVVLYILTFVPEDIAIGQVISHVKADRFAPVVIVG